MKKGGGGNIFLRGCKRRRATKKCEPFFFLLQAFFGRRGPAESQKKKRKTRGKAPVEKRHANDRRLLSLAKGGVEKKKKTFFPPRPAPCALLSRRALKIGLDRFFFPLSIKRKREIKKTTPAGPRRRESIIKRARIFSGDGGTWLRPANGAGMKRFRKERKKREKPSFF